MVLSVVLYGQTGTDAARRGDHYGAGVQVLAQSCGRFWSLAEADVGRWMEVEEVPHQAPWSNPSDEKFLYFCTGRKRGTKFS